MWRNRLWLRGMEESYCKVACIPGEEELWPIKHAFTQNKREKKTKNRLYWYKIHGILDKISLKCFYLGKWWDSGSKVDEYIKKQPSKSFQSCLVIAEYGSGVLWKAKPDVLLLRERQGVSCTDSSTHVGSTSSPHGPESGHQTQLSICQEMIGILETGPC